VRSKRIVGGGKCHIKSEEHCHPVLMSISLLQIVERGTHDIQDDYRIIVFEGSETLNHNAPLKSHITAPIDLATGFSVCISESVCLGDVMEDCREEFHGRT